MSLWATLIAQAQTAATYHSRADQAVQSFLLKFWNGGSQYLRKNFPADSALTGYWTYANGWDAVMDGVERTGGRQFAGWIETFYLGQNERGWSSAYYDDECWMTLALMRAYDLTGNIKYLGQAQWLYADIMAAWDTTCCGANKGGLWWDKAHTQKATAANAGAALAGARLYQRTGEASYLAFAQQAYAYWYTNMVNTSTYQVADHLALEGSKVWWRFTYNEGLMMGASVALNDVTGDATYLVKANNIAHYMVANEVTAAANGTVLYDGSNSGCGGDCHQFKGPGYRYLMGLYAKNPRADYLSILKASTDAVWNLARNPTSMVFSVNWAGPVQASGDDAQHSAAVMALNLYAKQAGPYPGTNSPANLYEAENGTLHHLGIETNYAGFTGWAYVAGWHNNGQAVDFNIQCPRTARYLVSFRYAAGAGNATRLVTMNGVEAVSNLSFSNTGAWTTYLTNTVVWSLPAGSNVITVSFNSARGNANYLNLDHLVVAEETIVITGFYVAPDGAVHLTWSTRPGQTYQVQYRDELSSGAWLDLGSPITAQAGSATAEDPMGNRRERYYRVVMP